MHHVSGTQLPPSLRGYFTQSGSDAAQKSTNNLDRDETYVPPTRTDFKLPDGKVAVKMDYVKILEETPAFTLFKLFIRQFL